MYLMIIVGTWQEIERLKDMIKCPHEGKECPKSNISCWDCFDAEYDVNLDIKELK